MHQVPASEIRQIQGQLRVHPPVVGSAWSGGLFSNHLQSLRSSAATTQAPSTPPPYTRTHTSPTPFSLPA